MRFHLKKSIQNNWTYVVIFLMAFVLYGNTISNNYGLDDNYVTEGNAQIAKGIKGIPDIVTTYYANLYNDNGEKMRFDYRPIVKITYAIEYELFGWNPYISHFFNVLIYGLLLIVLLGVLQMLFREMHPLFAFFVVMLFATHPVHTEVVASLKNRDEMLVYLFAFSSIHCFLRYIDIDRKMGLLTGAIWFMLAYFSKPSAIIFLAVIPLVIYFFRQVSFKKIAFVTLSAISLSFIFHIIVQSILPPYNRPVLFVENPLFFEDNRWLHFSTGFYVLLYYLKMLFFPIRLLFYYGFDQIKIVGFDNVWVIISIIIHIGLLAVAIKGIRKKHILSFAILLYFIMIVPYSNILISVMGIVADRFLFGPVLALSIIIVYYLFKLSSNTLKTSPFKTQKKWIVAGTLLIILLPYTLKTIQRNKDWKDKFTLIKSDIPYLKSSAKANYLYGFTLKNFIVRKEIWKKPEGKKDVDLMIHHFRQALKIYPEYYDAWNQLGEIYMVVFKDYPSAIKLFNKSLQLEPNLRKAYYNLAYVHYQTKKYKVSEQYFKKFLEYVPNHEQSHFFLGKIQLFQGDTLAAIDWNRKVIKANPKSVKAYYNIGDYFMRKGDSINALKHFEKAADIKPHNRSIVSRLHRYYKKIGNQKKADYYQNLLKE